MYLKLFFSKSSFFFFFISLPFLVKSSEVLNPREAKLIQAEELIENGSINIAYLILDAYLKSPNLSKEKKYRAYKDLAKIHLYEQDLVNFEKFNRKAYEIKKNQGEIYKGIYYAEKAFFWHFLTWADSAAFYSNRSMEIIQKNRKDFSKINVAFVYQMYAVGFLYRKIDPNSKVNVHHNLPISRILMNQWFDSAKVYEYKFPFSFSSDKVMLYRGVGTRYLDLVSGYNYRYKEFQKLMSNQQWFAYRKTLEAYNYTNKYIINPLNWNDVIYTNSLKGLNYMCIGEKLKAKKLFNTILRNHLKVYKSFEKSPNSQALLNLYSYKITNDEALPYNKIQTKNDIFILNNLRNSWWASFIQSKEYNYDTYSSSPDHYLFKLYLRRYFIKKKKNDLQLATSHLLSQILNFNFINKYNRTNSNRQKNAFLEFSKLNNETIKLKIHHLLKQNPSSLIEAPKVSISLIQNHLNDNECFLIPCFRKTFEDSYKIIITKNNISIVKANNDLNYTSIDYDTLSFDNYKKYAFQQYNDKIKPVLKINKSIKKVFVMYYDYSSYSIMIRDTMGKNYDQLNYLGKKIQFVTLYNPYEYFSRNKIITKNNLHFVKLNNKHLSNLPFIDHLSNKMFNPLGSKKSTFKGNLSELFVSRSILHLFGHGSLISNNDSGSKNIELPYQSNLVDSSISKINNDQIVKSSLIVLNNCFSGYNTNVSLREYDRGIYLNLLNNGALNIIVSPTKTDDQSSSKIFNYFYLNIAKGEPTDDALFHAQLSYLKVNNGIMAHPKFWSPYRLITNYPYSVLTVENKQVDNMFYFFLFCFILSAIVIHLYVQMKHF